MELQLERGNGGMWLHVAEAHLEGAGWWWWRVVVVVVVVVVVMMVV